MNRCGFVHMQTQDMAENAIKNLNNSLFNGANIVVERGRMKDRKPNQGGGQGGPQGNGPPVGRMNGGNRNGGGNRNDGGMMNRAPQQGGPMQGGFRGKSLIILTKLFNKSFMQFQEETWEEVNRTKCHKIRCKMAQDRCVKIDKTIVNKTETLLIRISRIMETEAEETSSDATTTMDRCQTIQTEE